ncbi:MAG: cytochrome c biogenesis protein ResB, partial [Candidatus Nanopelagicaceae bacterium]
MIKKKILNYIKRKNNLFYKIEFKIFQMNFNSKKENLIYGYKGLVGRISPILVHFSLILILFGSFVSAFNNFKAQEVLPKGEIFHIQNPLQIGWFTTL